MSLTTLPEGIEPTSLLVQLHVVRYADQGGRTGVLLLVHPEDLTKALDAENGDIYLFLDPATSWQIVSDIAGYQANEWREADEAEDEASPQGSDDGEAVSDSQG